MSRLVRKGEKRVAEEQIEDEAERRQHRDGAPEGFALESEIGSASEPPAERGHRDEKQQQADGVAERGWIVGCDLENAGMDDGAQGERRRNDQQRRR